SCYLGPGRRGTCSSRSAGASGHSISWLQRRWCHFLAACPIPSLSWREMDSNVRSPGTVGDVEPSFGQELLDIAIAQSEAEIEPDRVLDDLGREAMAEVAERSHATSYPIRR